MLKSYDEMTADQKLAYKMGREAERARWDDPAEIRAAVVPLLDLEAAAKAWHDHSVPELYMDVSSWSDCDDLYRDQVREHVRIAVYAALGLGEES